MRLGAHMSVAGGFEKAVLLGQKVGCDVVQIFTTAPGRWQRKKVTADDRDKLDAAIHDTGVSVIASHAIYLINIASTDSALRKKSIAALVEEVEACTILGVPHVVLHPGSGGNADRESAVQRCADSLSEVFAKTPTSRVSILLETTAGQGHMIGSSFEELAEIYQRVKNKKRLAYCLDTCHLFAAGYDLSSVKKFKEAVCDLDTLLGIEKVKLFHLNDSKHECGSRKDRHDHIGKGYLGVTGFHHVLHEKRFKNVPMILETPKGKDLFEDKMNLQVLRDLAM